MIEGISGILDVFGLATGGATSVLSMLMDGYMFVRDFVPQLQEGEEAVVDKVGARGLKDGIDNVLSKLPNIGEIINFIMGNKNEEDQRSDGESKIDPNAEQPMFLGGLVKGAKKAFMVLRMWSARLQVILLFKLLHHLFWCCSYHGRH